MFEKILNTIRQIFSTNDFIPLHAPIFIGNEKKYLEECIDTTFVSSVGKFVDKFETIVADYIGVKKAIVIVNGTEALHLALLLSGVKQGDEVITQPLTFIATTNAIAYTGAKPVFIDVDLDTMGLSPKKTEEFLQKYSIMKDDGFCYNKKTGRKISAILPMHTFGHPVKLSELSVICKKYNVQLIEDAAESIGSKYKGKYTGSFGKIGALSFNGNKTITTGGGGMLLTDDEMLGDYAKHLTTQAKISHPWEYSHDAIGFNYRMPNINAALGCAQFENLDYFIERKRWLANEYFESFKSFDVKFFIEPENCTSNYWLNCLIFKNLDERNAFLKYSNDNKVMTRPIWKLMNKLDMYKDFQCSDLSNAEWLEERVVNIPSSVILK